MFDDRNIAQLWRVDCTRLEHHHLIICTYITHWWPVTYTLDTIQYQLAIKLGCLSKVILLQLYLQVILHNTTHLLCGTECKKRVQLLYNTPLSSIFQSNYCWVYFLIRQIYKPVTIAVIGIQLTRNIMNQDQLQELLMDITTYPKFTRPGFNFARDPGKSNITIMIDYFSSTGIKLFQEATQ